MPIYEYHCGKCGDFEVMQKISDKPLGTCPTCRRKVTKLISSTSFQLKGSGWYITDYARKGGSGGGGEKSEKSSKSGDKGSETKAGGDTSSAGDASKSADAAAPAKKSGKASSEKAAAA